MFLKTHIEDKLNKKNQYLPLGYKKDRWRMTLVKQALEKNGLYLLVYIHIYDKWENYVWSGLSGILV